MGEILPALSGALLARLLRRPITMFPAGSMGICFRRALGGNRDPGRPSEDTMSRDVRTIFPEGVLGV